LRTACGPFNIFLTLQHPTPEHHPALKSADSTHHSGFLKHLHPIKPIQST